MTTPLNLLIIEDSEDDALLLVRELSKNGYALYSERIDTPEAMQTALSAKKWDIVISDFVMSHFSGLDALQMLKQSGIDIPFIIVSGKRGEEMAVDAMKAGADDYILKGNFARLLPAVKRELADAEVHRKCQLADEEIKIQEEQILCKQHELDAERLRYQELYNMAPVGYMTLNESGHILEANLVAANMLGLARSALVKLPVCRFIPKEDQDVYYLQRKKCFDSCNPQVWEMRLVRTDCSTFWAHLQATPAKNGEYWVTLTDISERKKQERKS
jgi:PAS domain S-box-containing protein